MRDTRRRGRPRRRGIGGASQDNYTPDPQCQLTKELTRGLYRTSNVHSQPLQSDTHRIAWNRVALVISWPIGVLFTYLLGTVAPALV